MLYFDKLVARPLLWYMCLYSERRPFIPCDVEKQSCAAKTDNCTQTKINGSLIGLLFVWMLNFQWQIFHAYSW